MYSFAFPNMLSSTQANLISDKEAVKSNLKLLLSSERLSLFGDPYFGSRLKRALFVVFTIFTLLTVRVGWIQFVQGSELQTKAYMQQTMDRTINPKRGTIYDSTGKVVLAVSSTV